ncbi:MAG: Gfo/Idh/MocA family oxidoreductase [Thermoplasmataceae archaeon]
MDFGIVGLGNHSLNRIMPAFKTAGLSIRSVYSSDKEKGGRVAAEYGAEYFNDLKKMMSSDIDGVYIGSPNFLHFPQAKLALDSGKNVLLEKQMTLKTSEAEELISISEKSGLALAIGFHMRFHPALKKIMDIVRSGDIGDPVSVSGTWGGQPSSPHSTTDRQWWGEEDKAGGGSIMGTGVHVLDSILYVLGKPPERVFSVKFPANTLIDTTQQVDMIYTGMIATAVSSRKTRKPDNSLYVSGSEGTVFGKDIFGTSILGSLILNGKVLDTYSGGSPYEGELRSFASLINGKESNIALGRDGANIVRIVTAANESSSRGISISL